MALIAAKNAVVDSGLAIESCDKGRVSVVVGADKSQLSPALFFAEEVSKESARLVNPEFYKHLSVTGPCYNIRDMIGSQGASFGCGNGLGAIGAGMMSIWDDEADVVLAGNTEQSVHPYLISNEKEKAQADGSTVIVLEELNHALSRNARIYAELKAFTQTHSKGNTEKALSQSLKKSGLSPGSLSVLVHSTEPTHSTLNLPGSFLVANPSTYFGSTTGGLGSMYLAISVLIMEHRSIPRTLLFPASEPSVSGYKQIDPENILCVVHGSNDLISSVLLTKYRP